MSPSIFDGDGRVKVEPVNAPEHTRPMSVTRGQARRILQGVKRGVETSHSSAGSTAWVIVTYCIEQGLAYSLTCHYAPCKGFSTPQIIVGWSVRVRT